MPINVFTNKRRRLSHAAIAAGVGELRLSAKQVTGGGAVEPIPGFLYCNGATVARATYKRLFDLIGTTFNTGGEAGTDFRLPDFRGRFIAGATDSQPSGISVTGLVRGGVLGAEAIALAKTNLPVHTHTPGTLAIASGGSHAHGSSALTPNLVNTAQSNDFAWAPGSASDQAGVSQPKVLDGGTATAITHTHAPDAGTVTGPGPGASTGHQNVHPHQAFGGVLVAY